MTHNTDPYHLIAIAGDPLTQGGPLVYAHTWFDGHRMFAMTHTNPDHPDSNRIVQEDYLPAVVQKIKEVRGWDYGSYEVVVTTPWGNGEVKWSKDPISLEPTFGAANIPWTEERLCQKVRSFGEKVPSPIQIVDHDLSKYSFDPSLE